MKPVCLVDRPVVLVVIHVELAQLSALCFQDLRVPIAVATVAPTIINAAS